MITITSSGFFASICFFASAGQSKKSGRAYLDAYEANLKAIAQYQAKLASASEVEWVSTLLNAQADFTREIARAAAAQSREFLK